MLHLFLYLLQNYMKITAKVLKDGRTCTWNYFGIVPKLNCHLTEQKYLHPFFKYQTELVHTMD